MKHKLESRFLGEISITSDMQMIPPLSLFAESKEELKNLLLRVKEGSWLKKVSWLKTQHSKNKDHGIRFHYFMANRWENNGNSDRLYFWVPKSLWTVTAAMKLKDTCSWK